MQSYKLHVVSEHLKDRHPYLEPDFKDRYDPSEVYHAVFDRAIPKLVEILCMEGIEAEKYRDAFITLNEMCSHQENKDEMITLGLVEISSKYLHHSMIEIRREAVLLLGSLVSVMRGRDSSSIETFTGTEKLLFDENVDVREACGWFIGRFVMSRDGVDLFAQKQVYKSMISSFLKHTEPNSLKIEDAKFIIYLLESFVYILQYDNGIEFFLNCGLVKRLNELLSLKSSEFIKLFGKKVNHLCLSCLAKIMFNMEGKNEGIRENVLVTVNAYLRSTDMEEINQTVQLVMSLSIHLEGKKQSVSIDNNGIIKGLITILLSSDKFPDLRTNVKQAIINISDYEEGFLVVCRILASHIDYLKEIFEVRSVKGLAALLPKTRDLERPPLLPEKDVENLKQYNTALCYFLKNFPEAVEIVINETVNIVERILPFLVFREELTTAAILKICTNSEYSKGLLRKYLEKYGSEQIKSFSTSLNSEVQKSKLMRDFLEDK